MSDLQDMATSEGAVAFGSASMKEAIRFAKALKELDALLTPVALPKGAAMAAPTQDLTEFQREHLRAASIRVGLLVSSAMEVVNFEATESEQPCSTRSGCVLASPASAEVSLRPDASGLEKDL